MFHSKRLLPLLVLLAASSAWAEPPKLAITGPASVTPGSAVFLSLETDAVAVEWIVFPQSAAGNFVPLTLYQGQTPDGKPILKYAAFFSSPTKGSYTFAAVGVKDNQIGKAVHTLVNGGPTPDPQPDPDPDPEPDPNPFPVPPAKAFVLVLSESGDRTAEVAATLHGLGTWLTSQSLNYRIEDPDLKGPDGKPSPWLQTYKAHAQTGNVQLPALFVGELGGDGKVTKITVVPLPATGAAAIEVVKGRLAK